MSKKNMSAKLLERMNGPRRVGCYDIGGVNLKLYLDTWESPKCLRVADGNNILAKIKIPQSEPKSLNDIEIIEGNLTPEQLRDTFRVLTEHTVGMVGWRAAYILSICNDIMEM